MRRILMVTVATIILLWPASPTTAQASSILQTRSFRTNLVKGEYVDLEAEEIITDPEEIEEPEPMDGQESQESDEHTDVSTPTDIESVVDEKTGELEEPVDVQLDAPENIGDSTEPEVETPMDSEDSEENEEEHETEVQESE